MQPVNRIAPDEGYVLCYDCDGVGVCIVCDGKAKVDGKLCNLCSGRRYCIFCKGTGQVRPAFFPDPSRVLRARTSEECRLYFQLYPHDCGEKSFPARAQIDRRGDDLVAVYESACPRCNKQRRVEFILEEDKSAPSKLLDPGEFLYAADEAAKQVPSSLDGIEGDRARYVREKLAEAVMWIEEVLKFIPAGQAAVPASAFFAEIGTRLYRQEPGRFERARLEAVLATYRDGLCAFDQELTSREKQRDRALMKDFMASVIESMRSPEDPAELARIQADHDRQADVIYINNFRRGKRPAQARSRAEMEFAARLEPCPTCGAREFGAFALRNADASWELDATCRKCGTKKTLAFTTISGIDPDKVVPPPGELGRRASRAIPAEHFEAELARVWPHVASDADAWQTALVCINELIKLTGLTYQHEPWVKRRDELMRRAP